VQLSAIERVLFNFFNLDAIILSIEDISFILY